MRFGLWIGLVLLSLGAAAAEGDADSLLRAGVQSFFDAKPKEAVAAFDKVIQLEPRALPLLWQRGLALYYIDNFKEGRKQFEEHQKANPNDVENAAWHFLCVARSEGVEAARKALIHIEGDTRVPMKEVFALFEGKGTDSDVLKAAEADTGTEEALRNQRCFAHLYLGLYHEALGNTEKAREHIVKAAETYKMDHYMGRCAQVHAKLRGWLK